MARLPRPTLVLHLVSLALLAVFLFRIGRNQWFFYDDWDVLVDNHQWDLLTAHNGHLSFSLALVFTVLKLIFGLHSYLPYLAITILLHVALVHLLWRLMIRFGVHPLISVLLPLVLGVLAAGAENTMWAFQLGFIAPLVTGMIAVLVVMRPVLRTRDIVTVTALLLLGLSFASTGIPVFAVVILLVWARHGWRSALVPGVIVLVPYLLWRIGFARSDAATSALAAHGIRDYLVGVPQFIIASLVDSLSAAGPFGALAPILLVGIALWLFLQIRRAPVRAASPAAFLAAGALVFAVLIAVSRLNNGVENAAPGRYVYVYIALCIPLVGALLTSLAGRTAFGLVVAGVALLVIIGFNGVQLTQSAINQAGLEQFTKQSISAVLARSADGHYSAALRPFPISAPQLTLGDLREFTNRGQLSVGPYDASADLSARVGLDLRASTASAGAGVSCVTTTADTLVLPAGTGTRFIRQTGSSGEVGLVATRDGVSSQYTEVALSHGVNRLSGLADASLRLANSGHHLEMCTAADTGTG